MAAGPFPLPSSPWQEAQYLRNVTLPDAVLACFGTDFCSLLLCGRATPRAVTSAAPKKITLSRVIGSFSRFSKEGIQVATRFSPRSKIVDVISTVVFSGSPRFLVNAIHKQV